MRYYCKLVYQEKDIDNLDMFLYGIADGFDDNYLYGVIKLINRNLLADYYDFYLLTGMVLVDASAVITFGGIAGTSDAIANANFARAAAEGAAGGLALATGVGAPAGVALAGDALGAVVIGAVGKVVAVSAAAASACSAYILSVDGCRLAGKNIPLSKNKRDHILNRHNFERVKQQIPYQIQSSSYDQVADDIASRNFFNRNWSEQQCVEAAETAFNKLLKEGKTTGNYEVEVFGENITVIIKDGLFDTAWGPHHNTLSDFGF